MTSEGTGESQHPPKGAKRKRMQAEMIVSMEGRLSLLEGYVSHIEEQVVELKRSSEQVLELREAMEQVLELKGVVEQLQTRAVFAAIPHCDIPKPKSYGGKRDATEVEDFLWHMEQYFKIANIMNDRARVQIASYYLTHSANVWWRRKCQESENGEEPIDTYNAFKKALKKQFLPTNVKQRALETLNNLRHTTTIQAYVQAFTEVSLYLKNFPESFFLCFFISGLQKWAKDEIEKRDVNNLNQAISIVESLPDRRRIEVSSRSLSQSDNSGRDGGSRPSFNQNGIAFNQNGGNRPSFSRGGDKKKGSLSCFICKGPHYMRDCSKSY